MYVNKKTIQIFSLAFAFTLFLASCATETIIIPSQQNDEVTAIPSDVTKLFVEKGNSNSDTVILYSVGGPQPRFMTTPPTDFDDLEFSRFREVYVHQTNTYNGDVIIKQLNKDLTFERAVREDSVSGEFLFQAVTYYSNLGKKVFIVGHSFGAFIIPIMLALHPSATSKVEKILIMAGRLDMPDLVWNGYKNRQPYEFIDGITPVGQEISTYTFPTLSLYDMYAITRLQAGAGQYRFTQRLANTDLSRVVYAHAGKDVNVGRLSDNEVKFLMDKKARVYYVAEGDHGSMFDSPHKENLIQYLLSSN